MDGTGSLTFRRPRVSEILSLLLLVPLGVLCLVGSPLAIVESIRTQPLVVAVGMSVFGCCPSWRSGPSCVALMLFSVRKVTVTRHRIRLSWWMRRPRTIDLSSLTHIALYGDRPQLVFLPSFGPPLLTLETGDFPAAMPDAIGEHVGVQVERLDNVEKSEYCRRNIRRMPRRLPRGADSMMSGGGGAGNGEG